MNFNLKTVCFTLTKQRILSTLLWLPSYFFACTSVPTDVVHELRCCLYTANGGIYTYEEQQSNIGKHNSKIKLLTFNYNRNKGNCKSM